MTLLCSANIVIRRKVARSELLYEHVQTEKVVW
jgi:hypothetical protein